MIYDCSCRVYIDLSHASRVRNIEYNPVLVVVTRSILENKMVTISS